MDGTVLDTLTDLTDSLSVVFKSRGLSVLTREKVRANLGYGYSGLMKSSAPDASEEERARMAEDFKRDYAIRCRRHTCPYDGIPEALQYLKTKGYRLAVVSNKGQEAVTTLHNKFFRNYAEFSLGETLAIPKNRLRKCSLRLSAVSISRRPKPSMSATRKWIFKRPKTQVPTLSLLPGGFVTKIS